MTSTDQARILDRGYRRYDGHRAGVANAMWSVARHTSRSILGLGRPARHKVFPIVVALIGFVPALAFLAVAVLVGNMFEGALVPEYWELFGMSIGAALLFTALIAPEAIVRDRRNGMLPLYLASPLTTWTYLLSKAWAVVMTMSIVVIAPVFFFLVGLTMQGFGPDGVVDWISVALRILVGGLVIVVIYAVLSMGLASTTDRRAFASIAVIIVVFGASIAANVLVEFAELNSHLLLLDPIGSPYEVPARLFGARSSSFKEIGTVPLVGAVIAWFALGAGLLVARYRKVQVV